MKTRTQGFTHHQQGSVLIVALMLLLVLTTLGISSMGNMTMEERMASSYQRGELAFSGGERAIESAIAQARFSRTSAGIGAGAVDPLVATTMNVSKCGQGEPADLPENTVPASSQSVGTTSSQMKVVYRGPATGLMLMKGYDSESAIYAFDIHADTSVKVAGITTARVTQVQSVKWMGLPRDDSGDCFYNKDEPIQMDL